MPNNSRIAFFGTPELCLPILGALEQSGHAPSVVVTNPDRPVGRKQIMTAPAVKTWAESRGIPVLQPERVNPAFVDEFAAYNIDLSIVVAYGQILPQTMIDAPCLGTINIHYSLLPRWRGASPVEAAILAGDDTTGVSIQQMVFRLDAGPVLATRELSVPGDITGPDLRASLTTLGADLLVDTLPDILSQSITPNPQDGALATYCKKINKSEAEVTLDDNPVQLWRKFRAYQAWPRLFYIDDAGIRTIITEAEYANGKFLPKKILPAGGRERSF